MPSLVPTSLKAARYNAPTAPGLSLSAGIPSADCGGKPHRPTPGRVPAALFTVR